jgi:hypothetical protein
VTAGVKRCGRVLDTPTPQKKSVHEGDLGALLRWSAAGMLEAERQFRKIIGYRDLATLVVAIERDHERRRQAQAARNRTEEAAIVGAA